MKVQELIEILNNVKYKEVEVMLFDRLKSSSEDPVFCEIMEAYFNGYTNSFLIY